ncbi:Mannosyltransferase putative [Seminavis robusta]|uniref:Mannosyltransferase putative n=1 Tax=Seminavis robusta TaxID=568900 RepID=A0A9N8E956_9STRA|nr:Mannosyltransferase putative [Seminavis robusta]|eukprot:Sro761_g198580.1 Mannosyltransferase putative (591) ;mRNA; f:40241-42013
MLRRTPKSASKPVPVVVDTTTNQSPPKVRPPRPFQKRNKLLAICLVTILCVTTLVLLLIHLVVFPRYHFRPPSLLYQHSQSDDYECRGWHTTSPDWSLLTLRYQRRTLGRVLRPLRYLRHVLGVASAGCHDKIEGDEMGYCEVVHQGTTMRVLDQSSSVYSYQNPFLYTRLRPFWQCSMVADFVTYKEQIIKQPLEPANPPLYERTMHAKATPQGRGIIIGLNPQQLPSIYSLVRLLRHELNCQLPIELWAQGGEDGIGMHTYSMHDGALLEALLRQSNVVLQTHWDYRYEYSRTRPYGLAHSSFEEVLILNGDTFPLRDPSFLFEIPQYQETGALFWKDVAWSDDSETTGAGTLHPLLWELLGIPKEHPIRNEMELSSGQMVIHRRKCETPIQLLLFFAQTFSKWFRPLQLLYGDKDLYRLAWRLTQSPFHYVEQPPALVQTSTTSWRSQTEWYGLKLKSCAQTLAMADPQTGNPLFLQYKGGPILNTTTALWGDTVTVFEGTTALETQYKVGMSWFWQNGQQPPVNGVWMDDAQRCYYTHPQSSFRNQFQERSLRDTTRAAEKVEQAVLRYTKEALELQSQKKTKTDS